MSVEEIFNGLLLGMLLSWALWRPLEKFGVFLLIAFVVPVRLIKNRTRIGVWDIRPTMDVVDEILDGGEPTWRGP